MQKRILILFLFIVQCAYSQHTFQKTYGGIGHMNANAVRQTADGGYIMAGTSDSVSSLLSDICLIKTDATGDTMWTRIISDTADFSTASVVQTNDFGYLVCGSRLNVSATDQDIVLIKFDVNGSVQWMKSYGGPNYEQGYCAIQTTNGGYAVAGYTSSFGAGQSDYYLIRTNSSGNVLWSKTYGGINAEQARSVQQTSDGGFILCGEAISFGSGAEDVYLVKTDSSGTLLWNRVYGGTSQDHGYSVSQTTDGGYIVFGTTPNSVSLDTDACMIKTQANGDTSWIRCFRTIYYDDIFSGRQTNDGGYVMCGTWNSTYALLIRADANGELVYGNIFGFSGSDGSASIQQTSDSGFVMAGYSNVYFPYFGVYLVKTDSLGLSGCYENIAPFVPMYYSQQVSVPAPTVSSPVTNVTNLNYYIFNKGADSTLCLTVDVPDERTIGAFSFSVYPNPTHSSFTIQLNKEFGIGNWELDIYDITGREVYHQRIQNHKQETINHELKAGLYLVRVKGDGGEEAVQKLIIE